MLLLFTFEMTLMKRIDRMDGKAFWVRLSMSMYRAFKVFGFFFNEMRVFDENRENCTCKKY